MAHKTIHSKTQRRVTEWVACEDELPEPFDGPILVCFPNGVVETVPCEDYFKPIHDGFDLHGNRLRSKWYSHRGITHWALVPVPPCPRASENTDMEEPEISTYDSCAVCPFCGHPHHDCWEWFCDGDNDMAETECEECDKPIVVQQIVHMNYLVTPQKRG